MEYEEWITWWITFCIRYSRLFWIYLKKHREKTDAPSIRIYKHKIQNIITFKIKTRFCLDLLIMSEAMKLLGSTKSEITEDEDGENMLHLEITEIIFVGYNIVNNDHQQDPRVLYQFIPDKLLVQLRYIYPKILYFSKPLI